MHPLFLSLLNVSATLLLAPDYGDSDPHAFCPAVEPLGTVNGQVRWDTCGGSMLACWRVAVRHAVRWCVGALVLFVLIQSGVWCLVSGVWCF